MSKGVPLNKLPHRRTTSHRGIAIPVKSSHHRYPRIGAGGHCLRLPFVPQFVKQNHLGRQTADRLQNAHFFGIALQYVAARERLYPRQFPPLVHHRHAVAPRRQQHRRIPQ